MKVGGRLVGEFGQVIEAEASQPSPIPQSPIPHRPIHSSSRAAH